MIIARLGIFLVLLFVFLQMFALSDLDDAKLDAELGQLSSLLKPFVDPELIQSEIHSVGEFESVEYLETSLLEPVSSKVSTSKGDFMVIGAVSGLKGQRVTITGLDDTRLKPKLCIETECFKLRNAPSL